MIKLIDILGEILQESNIIKIPQSELNKADRVYNFIKQNFDKLVLKSKNRPFNKPTLLPTLQNYFKIKDYNDKIVKISIGFYEDSSINTIGMMDSSNNMLLINTKSLTKHNLLDFKEFIEHELIHAIDPKVQKSDLYNREFAKKGAEPKGDNEEYDKLVYKYVKSPWEFDAFTAPLINRIKRNINKAEDPGELKDLLNQFLHDLRTKEPDELVSQPKYRMIPWLFTNEEWDSNNVDKISSDYLSEANKMKIWLSKPTLYTRFLKRLFKNI